MNGRAERIKVVQPQSVRQMMDGGRVQLARQFRAFRKTVRQPRLQNIREYRAKQRDADGPTNGAEQRDARGGYAILIRRHAVLHRQHQHLHCLLYTSDAADDLQPV